MANTYLTRTQGTATNRKKWTISTWFKLSHYTNDAHLFSIGDTGSVTALYLHNTGIVRFYGSTNSIALYTNRLLRDFSGWYHFVLAFDSTQSTEADRLKMYINGVQETSFDTATYPTLNSDSDVGINGEAFHIGMSKDSDGHFSGLMSHFHFVDGTAYGADSFGEEDASTGEWKIKTSPSVTYGDNGFFVLKDGNSVTDQSGESNNLTVSGGTLTNTEDCPSNVFCTLNPLNNTVSGTAPVYSNGNNTVVTGTSSADFGGSGTFGLKKGVWYYEGLVVTSGNDNLRSIFGITSNPAETARNNQEIYHNRYSFSWKGYNGAWWTNTNATNGNGTENVDYLNTYTNGDYIGIYFDLDNSKMLFTKNGTLERSGVSMSITAVGSTDTGFYFPIYTDGHSAWSSSAKLNFGNGSFGTTSLTGSENSDWFRDAGGIGKFKYNPTQTIDGTTWNARAICTKNINTYG